MFKNLKRKSRVEQVLYCFISLLFLAVALSYIYILVWTLISSLKTHQEIVLNPFSLPKTWNWRNYVDILDVFEVNGNGFWIMLFNSLWFSILGAFLAEFTTISFSYCATNYTFPGSKLIYPIILIMTSLPIYGNAGAMYRLINGFGLIDNYAHVLLSASGFSIAFLYYRAFFQNLSPTYAEAAMMDGAGDYVIFFKVIFPQARPIFTALYLTSWLYSWNNYESALVYLPNLPTLPVGIYQFNVEMVYRARLDILFAACICVSVPALVLFIAFNKVLTTNVSLGGIKG